MSPPASSSAGPTFLERALRWLAWCATALVLLAACTYLAVRHVVWPNLDRWRPLIARELSEAAGRPVSIGPLSTGFDGLRPWLVVEQASIADPEGRVALAAARVRAVLSLRAALRGELRFALLEADGPSMRIERLGERRIRVGGFDLDLDAPSGGSSLEPLFSHRKVVLQGARVDWTDRVTGETLQLDGVDIAIGSVGRQHRASVRVPALADVGEGIEAAIDFRRPPFVPVSDWRQWHGEAYVAATGVDLAALSRRWDRWRSGGLVDTAPPDGISVESGRARWRAWAWFEPAQALQARVALAAEALQARLDGKPLPLSAVRAEARVRHELSRVGVREGGDESEHPGEGPRAGETTIVFPKLEFDDGEGRMLVAVQGEPMLRLGHRLEPRAVRLALGRFDAAGLHAWVSRLPWPADIHDRLARVSVAGVVDRFVLDWSRRPQPNLDMEVDFQGLSLVRREPSAPRAGELHWPSFANVSGNARLTREGGSAKLSGDAVVLRFPGLFAEPAVPLDRVDARLAWHVDLNAQGEAGAPVELRIESLRFANADAAGELTGLYRSGGKGAGIVDLAGRLERADAARTARYLPLVIPAQVREWVRDSVRAGRSDEVRFVLQGDLEDFPYRDPASGRFEVEARLSDTKLQYAPGWPAIDRIRGTLRFERAGMTIDAQSGTVWNVALSGMRARIADFAEPTLRVEGSGKGPAQDMVRFVNESALRNRIDDFTRDTKVGGDATLQLALELPLDRLDDTKAAGSVRFGGNDLVLDSTLPPFDSVRGLLEFTEERLALRELQGGFLGGEVRVDGETPEPGRFRLTAQGRIPAAGLVRVHDNSLTRRLSGSTAYRAQIEVRNRASRLTIESDLVGLASSLPAPFAKRADEAWPLRIESIPSTPPARDERPLRETLRATLRDDARLVLERERDPDSQRLVARRGAFAFGGDVSVPSEGFAAVVHATALDLDAWRQVFGDPVAPAAAEPVQGHAGGLALRPDTVSFVAADVRFGGRDWHDVVLGATRTGDSWGASLYARGIGGHLQWRAPSADAAHGSLLARFTQLSIPEDRIEDFETLLDPAPGRLPGLDIVAEELVLNGRPLGALELLANNVGGDSAPVWQLQRLRIRNEAATLDATGRWQALPGQSRSTSSLEFELAIDDAGKLLTRFDFRDVLKGGAGRLGGRVQWNGSPMRLDHRSLDGELALSLGKGQFLKTEPGIAKLIGVLNLQSLRRRLVFDFRDVFAEGFAFDELDGKVRIDDGVARSDDFRMRGVAAQVRIRGEADIAAETQSLVVQVRPELNAGLASLAYAAIANPALGLGSFVAQMVLREPLQQIFAYEYDVTGPWDDPQVTRRARPPGTAPAPDIPPVGPQ